MKLISLFIVVFLSLSSVKCQEQQKSNFTDHYSFKKIKKAHSLGQYSMLYKSDNKIYFNEKHGKITSPLKYKNTTEDFDFNNIYELKDKDNHTYYFKFG